MVIKKKLVRLILLFLIFLLVSSSLSLSAKASDDDTWTGTDKWLHLGVSFGLSIAAFNIYKKTTNMTETQAKIAAFFTTVALGALKECFDKEFSGKDLAFDAAGGGIGAVIAFEF